MTNVDYHKRLSKHGFLYGAIGGLFYALLAWGQDAFILAAAGHTIPFAKLIVGALVAVSLGGLAGWLSARRQKPLLSVLVWLFTGYLLMRIVPLMQFGLFPKMIEYSNPALRGLLQFPVSKDIRIYYALGFFFTGLMSFFCGVLEQPLVENSILSSGSGAWVGPALFCAVIMGIAGWGMDNMVHVPLREPAQSLGSLIQFVAENEGNDIDPKEAKEKHVNTIKSLGADVYLKPYKLSVSRYELSNSGTVEYIVDFGGALHKCSVIYNSPLYCNPLGIP